MLLFRFVYTMCISLRRILQTYEFDSKMSIFELRSLVFRQNGGAVTLHGGISITATSFFAMH